jgi:quinoprotein glucose dehydrogenase
LAYWSDGRGDDRIVYVTPGYRMIALNAKTGVPIAGFGSSGIVDLKREDDQDIDPVTGEVGLHATPIIAKDIVIIGAAHRSGGVPRGRTNVKGYVRGYDVRTGKRLWIFHTIPRPGEFGNDTWEKDSWSYTGNAGVWAQISVDEELGLAYLPVELPTGDYYGGHRPGAGLFGESIVAVDIRTGVRKWHYQLVHHGLWDMDIPCAPILANITVNGRSIKALAQPTKQALMYVFDRVTGQPVWPIEERPVPKGDVPGEWYSPTQPHPLDAHGKLFAYDRQGFLIDDAVDFTPELHQQALQIISKYKIGPLFTPPVVSRAEGPIATIVLGANGGGTVWAGGAYDPDSQMLFIYSRRSPSPLGLVPPPDPSKNDMAFIQGSALTGARRDPAPGQAPAPAPAAGGEGGGGLSLQGLPIVKPPYGSISAIDLSKGEVAWQVAHGETPDFVRNHPMLKGLTIPRTGQAGIVGTLVTKTLLIAGDPQATTVPGRPRGAMLRAYDKTTGREVGAVYMPGPQSGSPMTYQATGKQYIVVAVGGGSYPGELLAFRAPAATDTQH